MTTLQIAGDVSGSVSLSIPAVAGSNTITFPAETGTLVTTASTSMPNTIAWDTTVKTSGFTAVAYGGYFCNTTGGAFTVTLPATPTRGQFVVIVDYAGTAASNNITVSGNGSNIKGVGSSATLATNRQGITFTYIDSTQGWLASSNVYGGSTPFTQSYTATYLIVAGGGGGGAGAGGGGGAGGLLTGTTTLTAGTVYTASVGAGGTGSPTAYVNTSNYNQGSNTTFTGLTTAVGGGGGSSGYTQAGQSGGSGGGGARRNSAAGGSGTPGQGNAGGSAHSSAQDAGGGGGGASAVGGSCPSGQVGGNGGAGTASSITGTPATYAGGGGGGGYITAGTGGSGGGGNGNSGPSSSSTGSAGTANTGGGGGGGTGGVGDAAGGTGGSGVVIISVPTANYSGTTTGSPTITTSGSNTIIKWTSGSGTYTA